MPRTVTAIPEQPEIDDRDRDFLETKELGDYAFLEHLNATQLGKRIEKQTNRPRERALKPKLVPEAESDDEPFSDEDGFGDGISNALDSLEGANENWDDEQSYELKPRMGGPEWRKKESTRLPVRTASGNLLQAVASSSESESEIETEKSDSDDGEGDLEEKQEQVAQEDLNDGPEAIMEAKEVLARLAEEITESPEEKVIYIIIHANASGFKSQVIQGNLQQRQCCR